MMVRDKVKKGSKIDQFTGVYSFLSNFYPSKITWEGRQYNTVEHAYQAAKCKLVSEQVSIWNAETPALAKHIGKRVILRNDWEDVKVSIMYQLVLFKFAYHSDLRDSLKSTGNKTLIEGNNWGDDYWGVDLRTGKGKNKLGRILMTVRALLLTNKIRVY